ncbi:TPA: hypothetical protein ACGQB3_001438 [Streptococcus agalactiae]
MKEKTIFISKKYANDFNNDKYNLSSVVCDKIVDADSISFVYHGEYETWHFKLLNTEAN